MTDLLSYKEIREWFYLYGPKGYLSRHKTKEELDKAIEEWTAFFKHYPQKYER